MYILTVIFPTYPISLEMLGPVQVITSYPCSTPGFNRSSQPFNSHDLIVNSHLNL